MLQRFFALGGALGLLCALAHPAAGQGLGDLTGSAPAAFYRHADAADIVVEVKVWGAVRHPGLYEVRQGIALSTLLTLAGGPDAATQTNATDRTFIVRLLRPQPEGGYAMLAETRMENAVAMLDEDPTLLQGDIVLAEEIVRQRTSWRDVLAVVASVGTLATIVLQVIQLTRSS